MLGKSILILFPLAFLCTTASALFADDAGTLDFLIATAGHGPNMMEVITNGSAIITYSPKSCYFASRAVLTGQVIWRRNLCVNGNEHSTAETSSVIDVTLAGSNVITMDATSFSKPMIRGWEVSSGALLWDIKLKEVHHAPEIWTFSKSNVDYIAVGVTGKVVLVINAASGKIVDDASRKEIENAKHRFEPSRSARCFDRTIGIEGENTITIKRADNQQSPVTATMDGSVDRLTLLTCTEASASILLTTKRGTTSRLTISGESDTVEVVWQQEEGLAQTSSGLMLDASHEDIIKSQQDTSSVLQFQSRLELQWKALTNMFVSKEGRRDHVFGFVKIAVLVSESSHRVYGIETAGEKRSSIRYQIDLPESATWHRMIHGSSNSKSGAHGVNGRASTRDVLILSYTDDSRTVDWICVDGTIGKVHATSSFVVPAPILQILPLAGTGSCRQNALLLLDDESLIHVFDGIVIPDNFYAHAFDKTSSVLKTFGIVQSQESKPSLTAHLVGMASFPGENILSVTYPSRDEVVASPCEILGDDSLLLKYLNPHLAVVVSMTPPDAFVDEEFLLSPGSTTLQKRKPAGVSKSKPETQWKSLEPPNLFINVVDTISGRIMYRASHANALSHPQPTVIVSENWIFYSFSNSKTRKAELGVLTLYEGMIDKKSLTAFSSPEQLTTFSSLDIRETKPVILAKTFTIPMAVTALGVTSTRSGVSVRNLLLAGIDGKIHSIDRKLLEPRRPLGPLKDIEKKEGLLQYHELIQTIPFQTLSYNQTVHSVRSIISVPTDLESQSLVLAIGGSDIFFARTSPSRGFDLLPDNFNKILLSIVVLALVGIMFFMQQLVSAKIRKQGWI